MDLEKMELEELRQRLAVKNTELRKKYAKQIYEISLKMR